MQSRQSDFLFSLSRAFGVLTEIAVISVIQRDFSEKLRRLVSPGEAHMTEWRVLGQNVSRANPEKTIQIARRFATVRTTTRGMAIDPECATRTVKTSGGAGQSGFSQHRATDSAKANTYYPPSTGTSTKGSSRSARRCPTRKDCRTTIRVLHSLKTRIADRKTPTPSNRRFPCQVLKQGMEISSTRLRVKIRRVATPFCVSKI